VNDRHTTPGAGVCTVCSDAFARPVAVTGEWRRYTVPLAEMRQAGWGAPPRPAPEVASLVNVGFRFAPGQDFDFSLRDVRLVRTASP